VKVALFGTFDTPNFGDCLFPLVVRQQIERRVNGAEVMPFSPTSRVPATAAYPRVYAFDELCEMPPAGPAAFMIGGGALLSTEHILFSYPQVRLACPYSLKCWLLPAMAARALNAPLILNGIGLGPFDPAFGPLASKYLAPAEVRGVRDGLTHNFLQRLGVSAQIVPDCGILTPDLHSSAEWSARFAELKQRFSLPEKYVAVQASVFLNAQLEPFAAAAADAARQAGLPAVLIPICHHLNDRVACRIMGHVFAQKNVEAKAVDAALTSLDTAALLSHAELFTGTSLHGTLVTMAFSKPAVSFTLPGMKKNPSVLEAVGVGGEPVVTDAALLPNAARAAFQRPAPNLQPAREKLDTFFDRVRGVICSTQTADRKEPAPRLTIERGLLKCEPQTCGPFDEDLREVKRLCRAYGKQVPLLRRLAAVAVRNNRIVSEWYDHARYRRDVRKQSGQK